MLEELRRLIWARGRGGIPWDVDKALRRYLQDPQGFRSQMAKYDALIHRSFAIQYFERESLGIVSLLVVSIQQGLGSERFTTYLLDIAGYIRLGS